MKNAIVYFILISFFPLLFEACDKNENENEGTGDVELYLLESYDTLEQSCAIEASTAVIKSEPLIKYSDFKSYNSKEYVFKITDDAIGAVKALEYPVNGLAFAVYADDQVVYTGYFWPAYSSLICQWTVIDPLILGWGAGNELHVELGYPGPMEGSEIPDHRNSEKILDIFRRDGKLIE